MTFKVDNNFFEKIPNAVFGVVVVKNFDNTKNYDFITDSFKENQKEALKKFEHIKIKEEN